MTVIAVASAKSRGVTTAAELLVLLRPTGRRCLLVDADPAGGEWLLRPGVEAEPGFVSLAHAGRRRLERQEVLGHVQVVGALELVAGPAAAEVASGALEGLGGRLVGHLRTVTEEVEGAWGTPVDSVVDCGRLTPGSPALAVARGADVVVVVTAPTAAALVHTAPWVKWLWDEGGVPAVLLHAGGARGPRYEADEVASGVGAEVLGTMADDVGGAGRLFDNPGRVDGLGRTLLRSMGPVAARAWALAAAAEASGPPVEPLVPPPGPLHVSYAPVGWKEAGRG